MRNDPLKIGRRKSQNAKSKKKAPAQEVRSQQLLPRPSCCRGFFLKLWEPPVKSGGTFCKRNFNLAAQGEGGCPTVFQRKKGFLKREPPNHRRRERQVQLIARSLDLGCSCRQARIKLQTAAFAVTVFPSAGSGKPVMNGLPVKIALLPGLFRHQLDLLPIGKGGDSA